MDVSIRPVTLDDAEMFAALSTAIERDHKTNLELSPDEFREFLPGADAHLDVAFDGDTAVAWSGFMRHAPHDSGQQMDVIGGVHPDQTGRGLGTLMTQRALQAARDRHAIDAAHVPGRYVYRTLAGRPEAEALASSLGFAAERYRFNMVTILAELGELPPLPADVEADYELVTFDPQEADLLCSMHNAAFHDYPNHSPMPPEQWRAFMVDARHTRPGVSWWWRSRADGSVAGYQFTHEYSSPISGIREGREAYVPFLATLPAHRGRGLASVLLRRSLHAYRDAGFDRTSLEVDAANPTGALGIYERSGFSATDRFDEYYLRDPAAPPGL